MEQSMKTAHKRMRETGIDDAWTRIREGALSEPESDENSSEEEKDRIDSRPMSIRQRIKELGKAALSRKAAAPPPEKYFKGLKRHIHYEQYQNLRNINKITLFNGLLSLVLAITSNEMHWTTTKTIQPKSAAMGPITKPNTFNEMTDILKILVSINVLLVVIGIFRYYRSLLELEKLRNTMLPQDTFYSAGYLPWVSLEIGICIIHPLPFVYFEWTKSERGGLFTIYGSDDLFTVLMLPRVYLLFRVFRDYYGLNSENARYIGTLCRVNLDHPFVTFKNLMLEQPITIVPMMYMFVISVLSYALCVLERPTDAEFLDIRNGIWVVFVTMTTVGYGDIYPNTDLGRFISVLACAAALLILMLLIIGMQSVLAPDAKEYKVFHILKYKRWRVAMRQQAAVVIQSFWRCARMLDRPDQPLVWNQSYRADTTLAFDVRAFRRLRAAEPLEQRDLGTLMWEMHGCLRTLEGKLDYIEESMNEDTGNPHKHEPRV